MNNLNHVWLPLENSKYRSFKKIFCKSLMKVRPLLQASCSRDSTSEVTLPVRAGRSQSDAILHRAHASEQNTRREVRMPKQYVHSHVFLHIVRETIFMNIIVAISQT